MIETTVSIQKTGTGVLGSNHNADQIKYFTSYEIRKKKNDFENDEPKREKRYSHLVFNFNLLPNTYYKKHIFNK